MTGSRTRAVLSCALACALLLAVPALASADSKVSKLRVEAGVQALEPGTLYSNDTVRAKTSGACGKTNRDSYKLWGHNATGLVANAARADDDLSPFRISDTFDFALIVCKIGSVSAFSANQAWLYKVNHEEAQVAGERFELSRGDEVLWYFANFASGVNTGKELDLRAPARSRPGQPFEVKAFTYSSDGDRQAEPGIVVSGGVTPVTTRPDGTAMVVAADDTRLRATRRNDIPSEPLKVCVDSDLSNCPAKRGERIVGTDDGDEIDGTRGDDRVKARGGRDRIDVRGGGRDKVDCGGGRDKVRADGDDKIDRDCEDVNR